MILCLEKPLPIWLHPSLFCKLVPYLALSQHNSDEIDMVGDYTWSRLGDPMDSYTVLVTSASRDGTRTSAQAEMTSLAVFWVTKAVYELKGEKVFSD